MKTQVKQGNKSLVTACLSGAAKLEWRQRGEKKKHSAVRERERKLEHRIARSLRDVSAVVAFDQIFLIFLYNPYVYLAR